MELLINRAQTRQQTINFLYYTRIIDIKNTDLDISNVFP